MSSNKVIPDELKLTIVCRVEPGCLGPKGAEILDEFCVVAQAEFDRIHASFVKWQILPRLDKSLAEIQYLISDRNLTRHQADLYLVSFDETVDRVEDYIAEVVAFSVNLFLFDRAEQGRT